MHMAPIRGLIMLLAEKYPDAVNDVRFCYNRRCNNIYDKIKYGPSSNGCIVGQAARMSNHPELLNRLYNTGYENGAYGYCNAKVLLDGCVDPQDIEFAYNVQAHQDNGVPWAKCVERALKYC